MSKGIVIRILPKHAESFRELWKELKKRNITPDENLHDAIYNELFNLSLRWQDAIGNYDEGSEDE